MDSRPLRSPAVATEEFDGEAVLYDERDGAVHVLNATAALVWQCLDGETTIAELIAELAAAYEADEATISEGVVAMTSDLAEKGLLTAE